MPDAELGSSVQTAHYKHQPRKSPISSQRRTGTWLLL